MLSLYSALSGELLTIVDDYESKTAKDVKEIRAVQMGCTRFRQRFLSKDRSEQIEDDEVFCSETPKRSSWCYWSGAALTWKTRC